MRFRPTLLVFPNFYSYFSKPMETWKNFFLHVSEARNENFIYEFTCASLFHKSGICFKSHHFNCEFLRHFILYASQVFYMWKLSNFRCEKKTSWVKMIQFHVFHVYGKTFVISSSLSLFENYQAIGFGCRSLD